MAAKKPARRAARAGGKNKTLLPDYSVSFFEGLNTFIKDLRQLADGQSPNSLNWITGRYQDHIQLRAGYQLLGKTRVNGLGRITGLGVGTDKNGKQIPYFTYGQKLKYYDSVADDTSEVGSNIFPVAAASDDFSIMPYKNIAGAYIYITSPNSSMYKLAMANPASFIDLGPTDYKGHAKAGTNRMFLWNRKDLKGQQYISAIFNSVPDLTTLSSYTQTTAQTAATGDGNTKAFSGTISVPQKTIFNVEFAGAINAGSGITAITSSGIITQITAAGNTLAVGDVVSFVGVGGMTQLNGLFATVIVAGSTFQVAINSSTFSAFTSGGTVYKCEYFIDDQNGLLNSNLGGTGTINYATGAFTLLFKTAPTNGIIVYEQFYSEGLLLSIADFSSSGAASFTQFDGGGDIMNLYSFDQVEYCFHKLTSWYLNVAAATAFNLPYRNRLGTPYLRAGFATEDGVVYLDNSISSQPRVQILTIDANSSTAVVTVVPQAISDTLDLSTFGFTQAAVFRWSEYDLLACASSQNGVVGTQNIGIFVRNIYSGQWDFVDIPASCFDELNGSLIAGDSLSDNVFTLFANYDDDGAQINNFWQGKMFNLGADGLKKFNRFVIKGLIQQDQNLDIAFSFDSGNFTKFFTVQGNGSYVNLGNPVTVGSSVAGLNVVGGGGSTVIAYPFEVEFVVNGDVFEYVQPQFSANNIGFVQIDEFVFKDVRMKSRRVLPSRTANPD